MEKWNEPKGPPPTWLDPAAELTHDTTPRFAKSEFVVACMDALLSLGCDPVQAAGVTANSLNEAAWGAACPFFNAGGWKITPPAARAYRLAHHGEGPPWWRAPGNKAPGATLADLRGGDPPWCYYRAFSSLATYFAEWLVHFVPQPGADAPYAAYRACGAAFWAGAEWFVLLCRAGYKGSNTQVHPDGAVHEHVQLCRAAATRWAQAKLLGVEQADGAWGPRSRAACSAFQTSRGLPVTGEADADTLAALAAT